MNNRLPNSALRRDFRAEMGRKSITLSVGTPLGPYDIAYRRAHGLSTRGLFSHFFEVSGVLGAVAGEIPLRRISGRDLLTV